MIKELRRKFIFISGISIFLVFVGIFVLISAFSMAQMDRTMDTLTDAISSNDGVFPDFEPSDYEDGDRETLMAAYPAFSEALEVLTGRCV